MANRKNLPPSRQSDSQWYSLPNADRKRPIVAFSISWEALDGLDTLVKRTGASRSALVDELILKYLEAVQPREKIPALPAPPLLPERKRALPPMSLNLNAPTRFLLDALCEPSGGPARVALEVLDECKRQNLHAPESIALLLRVSLTPALRATLETEREKAALENALFLVDWVALSQALVTAPHGPWSRGPLPRQTRKGHPWGAF